MYEHGRGRTGENGGGGLLRTSFNTQYNIKAWIGEEYEVYLALVSIGQG